MIRALLKTVANCRVAEAAVFGLAKMVGRLASANTAPAAVTREIDAVYLWVNDQDPIWQAKRAQYRPISESAVSAGKARFRQFNELLTSIKLLAVNAPFVRRVFIVVDEQTPDLETLGNQLPFEVVLVNHSEFIPKSYLPTFNSRAITAHLHLIPDLSERFIYLNDDVFIARPSVLSDWFVGDQPVLRFTETRFLERGSLAESEVLYRARWKGFDLARATGWNVSDQMPEHAPYPLTKSIMKSVWTKFPDAMAETAGSRFRTADSVLPELMAFYFAIGSGLAKYPARSSYKYVPMNEASALAPLIDLALHPNRFLTLCLNDVSVVDRGNRISERALASRYRRVLSLLESSVAK
ncbi:MAG: hypothetical protein RL197_500 [Actinomycetota bacterium]